MSRWMKQTVEKVQKANVKRVDLCGKCAALMSDAYKVKKMPGGADIKVICAHRGKRRYGGTFELEPRQKQDRS